MDADASVGRDVTGVVLSADGKTFPESADVLFSEQNPVFDGGTLASTRLNRIQPHCFVAV